MKLTVPFYIQGINECGPTTLQMALEFLGKKLDKEQIKKLVDSDYSGITLTMGLAKAAAQLGLKTEFYSVSLGFNTKNFDHEFYQKLTDGADSMKKKILELTKECLKHGVKFEERSILLNELLSKVSNDCIPIVLIDWGKVINAGKFIGHFVPIVGYDEKNVYIHQPGPKDPAAYFPVEKSLFDSARKASGTDEDLVFVYRP